MYVDDRMKLTSGPMPWFLFLIASQLISQNNMLYVFSCFLQEKWVVWCGKVLHVLAKPGGSGGEKGFTTVRSKLWSQELRQLTEARRLKRIKEVLDK